jgi:signal peptidase I
MEEKEEKAKPGWLQRVIIGKNPRFTLVRIAILIIVCLIIFPGVILPIRVEGISMLPTYHEGRINFVNRLAYMFHEPRRGDVVAIRMAGPHVMLMKRIVGTPGETVAFHDGHTWINGNRLEEPYIKTPWYWDQDPRKLGPDEYYFVGDNRSMPQADHTEGKASRERIVGKVLL